MEYIKGIDLVSRKVLVEYEAPETINNAAFLTENKGAIFTDKGVYEFNI